ncbi:MAG: efflux RND transporter periplasmic adaptor subunit [Candidatus Sumerlaeaceae bacterium]
MKEQAASKAGGGAAAPAAAAGGAGQKPAGPRKFPVRTSPVNTRPVQYEIQAVGNLMEENRYHVPAQVAGVAQDVNFTEGDRVTTGQQLCRIDYDRYQLLEKRAESDSEQKRAAVAKAEAGLADAVRDSSATVAKAKLDLELTESEYRRRISQATNSFTSPEERKQYESKFLQAQTSYRDSLGSAQTKTALAQAEVGEARTALASAQAALAIAQVDLKNAVIRAPIEGVVQQRLVTNGQYLVPGTTTAMMVQTDPLRLKFTVAESRAANLTRNMKVKFGVPAQAGRTFEATVYEVAATADLETREVQCWARVPNREGVLRPGYFASIRIVQESKSSAIVVPLASVLPTEAGMVSFIVQDGIAVRKKVQTGLQVSGDAIEILDGLEPGQPLVVEGMESLHDNVPVQVIPDRGRAPVATAEGPHTSAAKERS